LALSRILSPLQASRRSFDCVSRDETARDFAQDDNFYGVTVIGERRLRATLQTKGMAEPEFAGRICWTTGVVGVSVT
jgi:hypothetical protein